MHLGHEQGAPGVVADAHHGSRLDALRGVLDGQRVRLAGVRIEDRLADAQRLDRRELAGAELDLRTLGEAALVMVVGFILTSARARISGRCWP
jgi:hypothetical protein